jgi:hypothetical protein
MDAAFDALANRYRRSLLLSLLEHNPQEETDPHLAPDEAVDDETLAALEADIAHKHLPKLEAAGVIEWDRDAEQIVKGPKFDEIRPLLLLIAEHSDELPADWL